MSIVLIHWETPISSVFNILYNSVFISRRRVVFFSDLSSFDRRFLLLIDLLMIEQLSSLCCLISSLSKPSEKKTKTQSMFRYHLHRVLLVIARPETCKMELFSATGIFTIYLRLKEMVLLDLMWSRWTKWIIKSVQTLNRLVTEYHIARPSWISNVKFNCSIVVV